VYVLVAEGFSQRQPVLIQRAKHLLDQLSNRQDVYLERSICALLLGQTEEALGTLERSQEAETLRYIQACSLGSPDWLPGLCRYSEQWLTQEVYPHFRDLAVLPVSLKAYFEDATVQQYLEELPEATEVLEPSVPALPAAVPSSPVNNGSRSKRLEMPVVRSQPISSRLDVDDRWSVERDHQGLSEDFSSFASASASYDQSPEPTFSQKTTQESVAVLPRPLSLGGGDDIPIASQWNPEDSGFNYSQSGSLAVPSTSALGLTFPGTQAKPKLPFNLLILWGIGFLAVAGYAAFTNLFQISSSEVTLRGEQLQISLESPPVTIPDPTQSSALPSPTLSPANPKAPLAEETAGQVLETWFAAKSAAMGPTHEIDRLPTILAEPALSEWKKGAKEAEQQEWYWQYQHNLAADSLKVKSASAKAAEVEVEVREAAQKYESGQLSQGDSYDDSLLIRYQLVSDGSQWRIQTIEVLR
jgi:ARC6-like, IMS domain